MVTTADPCTGPATPRAAAAILESISQAFVSVDSQWRFTYINASAEEIFRTSRDHLLGRSMWEIFPTALGTVFEREYRRAMETRAACVLRAPFPRLSAWLEVKVYPIERGGLAFYFMDITEQRCAEKHMEWLRHALEVALARAPLDELMVAMAEALEEMCIQRARASILIIENGRFKVCAAPHLPQAWHAALNAWPLDAVASPFGEAAATLNVVALERVSEHPNAKFRELALAHDVHACWCAPIVSLRQTALGVLALLYGEPLSPLPREVRAASSLLSSAALVIERGQAV